MPGNRLIILASFFWLGAIASGFSALTKYAETPGPSSTTLKHWPNACTIERQGDRDFLVMFVHPQCPCSSASMEELNRLITKCRNNLAVTVLFVRPSQTSEDWTKSALWKEANSIPGVNVITDLGGIEAERFGASTSGQAFLFDRTGRVLFQGGITPSRGHAGDNAGVSAICQLVNGQPSPVSYTPVFGCRLTNSSQSRKATCVP